MTDARTATVPPRATPGDPVGQHAPLGVYVHIPFCASRCDYCDFATWTDRGALIDTYVDACVTDLTRRAETGELHEATTIFFGGGTPSLLAAPALIRILDAIPRVPDAEVTVECNPDSVDPAKLQAYRAAGVNRCSFGVQSLRPHVLAALGRTHDPHGVTRAVSTARDAGFERFNLDLIYGAVGESLDDWRATLDAVLALEPPHVSAYALTVEPATPLGRRVAAGVTPPPDDDDQAVKYELADAALTAAGLEWYEISNWAQPGQPCRQHLLYWSQGDYLGIGCAAHGHRDGVRTWNVRTPERYCERITAGATPVAGGEDLDAATRAEEALALALRTRAGIPVPTAPDAASAVADLRTAGLLEAGGAGVVLTRRGRLLASDVTVRILAAIEGSRRPVGTR
jgi:putative oxygen-independent coproporphyrinogen III oxidase